MIVPEKVKRLVDEALSILSGVCVDDPDFCTTCPFTNGCKLLCELAITLENYMREQHNEGKFRILEKEN